MTDSSLHLLSRETAGAQAPASAGARVPPPARHWKTRVALPAALVLVTAAFFGAALRDVLWSPTPVRVVAVLVKDSGQAPPAGSVVVQAPGWVEADPFPVGVSALADGVVEEVLVLEGETVERDQVVARLVADEARIALKHAESVVMEREAALESARAGFEEAQRNWEYPIELTRKLHTSEAALAETRAELERWPSELAREEARAVYLKAEYERIVPLHKSGQASDIELIEVRQAYQEQQAEVEIVRRNKALLEARIRSLGAEVAAAAENLRLRIVDTRALADATAAVRRAEAAVAAAQAAREDAALRLERMQVRSPVAGVVMTRLAEPGSKMMRAMDNPHSAQVVRLYDPRRLQVRVDVPLVDAAKVGVGQPAEVVVDVLPDRVFRGRVSRVVHEADVQKNTLQIKVAIEDPTPEIKPEMLARARMLSMPDEDTRENATAQRLFVPRAAILGSGDQTAVWLADQVDNVARRAAVTVGRAKIEDWVAIDDGLQPGDRVIIDAPPELTAGQRIRLIEN